MTKTECIYLDNQATTPVAETVMLKMLPYFADCFANPHSSEHVLGWNSAAAVEKARRQLACLIGAGEDEVFFTSGATESNNLAILGLAKRAALKKAKRNKILMSTMEHKSVLSIGRVLEDQFGFSTSYIPVDDKGFIIISELEKLLKNDVFLVSIMAVNNEIGTIQDIASISKIIKANNALFHCDASQAPIAVNMYKFADYVDALSLSGHKMYGPKGIGGLYINRKIHNDIEPLFYGGGQQNHIRPGTLPTPLCVGLGAAAEFISSDETQVKRRNLSTVRNRFHQKLLDLPFKSVVYGPKNNKRHPGNLSIGFKGVNGEDILAALQPCLAASTGSACISGVPEPSHVLKAIGLSTEETESVVRFSLGFDTTDQDIDQAVKLIEKALKKFIEL